MTTPTTRIDATPSWTSILPVLFLLLDKGTDESRTIAKNELKKMAKAADLYINQQKEK